VDKRRLGESAEDGTDRRFTNYPRRGAVRLVKKPPKQEQAED
jgi:hypothetical protein